MQSKRLTLRLVWSAWAWIFVGASAFGQTIAPVFETDFNAVHNLGATTGRITQMAFAPGDDQHLYVATYGQGILRFDYDPFTQTPTISNGAVIVPSSITDIGGVNGSLGLAFHQDPVLGSVMYLAPAVQFVGGGGEDTLRSQSIVRLTDSNADGTWGGSGDLHQAVVDNLEVTELHEVNQMQIQGDSLYVGIGSRTQNGGISTPGQGDQSHPGETAYTGTVSFIEDLTQLSSDTSTPNLAGFSIANHKTDTQTLTSTDPGKLRVFSTGLRNVYGIRMNPEGELWLTFNQNESPQLPDELHHTFYQADHGFEKRNDEVGDWRAGDSPESQTAIDAGFFQESVDPLALLGNNAAAGGFDFVTGGNREGDMVVSRWSRNDVILVDRETGDAQVLASGFNRPLEVLRDPLGNLLVGENVGSGRIFRIDVATGGTPLVIDVNRDSGETVLRNQSDDAVDFDGYTISSSSGALSPTEWTSLAASGELGGDWQESPATPHRISELQESEVAALASGEAVSLGKLFSPSSATFGQESEDLFFHYATPDGDFAAAINYTGTRVNTLLLEVDPVDGRARLRNTSEHTVEIDGYTILSTGGASLDPAAWNSLDSQDAAEGDWSASPGTTARLSEIQETASTELAPGALFELGQIFDAAAEQDLTFAFLLLDEEEPRAGRVLYNAFSPAPFGDYNDDGVVDAADYTIWRDNLNTDAALPNDQSPGSVAMADYLVWKNNYGASVAHGGTSTGAPVPEPARAALALVALCAHGVWRIRRPRWKT